jgi:hypothetical protein
LSERRITPRQPTTAERTELHALAYDQGVARDTRQGRRARAIILLTAGAGPHYVAEQLRLSPTGVRLWCRRFNAEGVAGLQDRPRSGRPRKNLDGGAR